MKRAAGGCQARIASINGLTPRIAITRFMSAERRDIGAATGCLLFLRSMGGAFGSTMVGALLASGFASHLAAIGVTAHVDLGEIRQRSGALANIPAAMIPHMMPGL